MQLFSRNRLLMKHIKKGSPEKPGSLEADYLGLEETDGAYIMPMPPIPPMPPFFAIQRMTRENIRKISTKGNT